ncbi:hypothetical protein M3Y97_00919400 [Aphelenchoides bicaudatus]|nr:hypothetical protein M3Y97_00919400 [Aphelenchoides bicaudatus]
MTRFLFKLICFLLIIEIGRSAPNQVVELEKPVVPSAETKAETQPAGHVEQPQVPPSQSPAETQPVDDIESKPVRVKRSEQIDHKKLIVESLENAEDKVFQHYLDEETKKLGEHANDAFKGMNPAKLRSIFVEMAKSLPDQEAKDIFMTAFPSIPIAGLSSDQTSALAQTFISKMRPNALKAIYTVCSNGMFRICLHCHQREPKFCQVTGLITLSRLSGSFFLVSLFSSSSMSGGSLSGGNVQILWLQ